MLVAIIFGGFEKSIFGKDLIWRNYWKKVVGVHILILAEFMNLPISPNKSLYPGSQTLFLVNLTWRAVKGCVTKILSMGPQELIEVAQP